MVFFFCLVVVVVVCCCCFLLLLLLFLFFLCLFWGGGCFCVFCLFVFVCLFVCLFLLCLFFFFFFGGGLSVGSHIFIMTRWRHLIWPIRYHGISQYFEQVWKRMKRYLSMPSPLEYNSPPPMSQPNIYDNEDAISVGTTITWTQISKYEFRVLLWMQTSYFRSTGFRVYMYDKFDGSAITLLATDEEYSLFFNDIPVKLR